MSRLTTVLLTFVAIIVAIYIGRFSTTASTFVSLGLVTSTALIGLTFVNPTLGIYILTISMLLSPEIALFQTAKRAAIIRLDDIFIIVVCITWLVRSSIYKQAKLFKYTPLNKPIILYIFICIISSFLGVIRGYANPTLAFFYTAKYIEYLILYFVVVNSIDTEEQVKRLVFLALIVSVIVTIHAYYQMSLGSRPYCPFDIEKGRIEPATIGGYLLIIMGLLLGLIVYEEKRHWLIVLISLFAINLAPIARSLSRATYLGFSAFILAFPFLTKKRRIQYIGTVLVGIIIFIFAAQPLWQLMLFRITQTTRQAHTKVAVAGKEIALETSAVARIKYWKYIFTKFLVENPIIGRGVARLPVEGQIPLIIGETGVLGLLSFSWIMITIWRETKILYKTYEDNIIKGMSLGFLTACIGLFFHALTTNTFIIIRIMEPFCFFSGLIMVLRNNQEFGDSQTSS